MYRLNNCSLVYKRNSRDANGNPTVLAIEKVVKCTVMDSFSLNYYQNQQRDMRSSRNIVIAKPYTFDHVVGDDHYQLEEVKFDGRRFKVQNILLNRNSAITSILDCQEIMNA